MRGKIPLLVIAGPTATGKTALGVRLAKNLDGEIVSADSMQVYKKMNIATAKPLPEEMEGIPHHLMDILEPGESFSVAQYVKMAHAVILGINEREKIPILVGGTGLYINSVVDNISYFDNEGSDKIRRKLYGEAEKQNGREILLEKLRQVDPAAAARLSPNNLGRIVRALEVFQSTGVPISRWQELSREEPSPYELVVIGLNYQSREKLYQKIDKRVDKMLRDGLLWEAESLRKHLSGSATAGQAIGYKELWDYFDHKISLNEAVENIKRDSRRYAKRQITWFKRDKRIHWIMVDDMNMDEILAKSINTLEKINETWYTSYI